eukprot:334270-Hanusia_phi.AAC.3
MEMRHTEVMYVSSATCNHGILQLVLKRSLWSFQMTEETDAVVEALKQGANANAVDGERGWFCSPGRFSALQSRRSDHGFEGVGRTALHYCSLRPAIDSRIVSLLIQLGAGMLALNLTFICVELLPLLSFIIFISLRLGIANEPALGSGSRDGENDCFSLIFTVIICVSEGLSV